MGTAPDTLDSTLPRPRRHIAVWKWLLAGGGLIVLLLLVAVGIALWPRWQEWRLISYLRAHGGEVELKRKQVEDLFGKSEHNVVVKIRLPDDAIRRIDLARLATLQDLDELEISDAILEPYQIQAVERLVSIEEVTLRHCFLYGDCCAPLARVPGLRRLGFFDCDFEDETILGSLAGSQTLALVNLDCRKCTDRGGIQLAKVKSLTEVYFGRASIGDETVAAIATLPKLAYLSVSNSRVTDAGIEHLRACANLRRLDCENTAVAGSCLPALATLPKLQGLNLNGTQVTARAAIPLGDFRELMTLSLNDLSLDDKIAPALIKLKKLRSLDLRDNAITDAGAAELATLPLLMYLNLERSEVTSEGIDRLRTAYPKVQIASPNFHLQGEPPSESPPDPDPLTDPSYNLLEPFAEP